MPYDVIETDAIFSIDDDVVFEHDEILLGFRYCTFFKEQLVYCRPWVARTTAIRSPILIQLPLSFPFGLHYTTQTYVLISTCYVCYQNLH